MYWINEMQNAISFIEARLPDDLSIEEIASSANSSTANFQRIFSIVTGMTVGDYIRSRRLSLAGYELANTGAKAMDVAAKYGYETAESFTKAFTRFHGVTPSDVMRRNANVTTFAPISIKVDVRGGFNMKRKIIPNIPVISYYGNEVDYVINLLEATFTATGEATDRTELAAYSGMSNRFCWTPGKWVFGNEIMASINETPFETEVRMLKAIGWTAKFITVHRDTDGSPINTDNQQLRRDFVAAIDKGYPVLYLCTETHRYNIVIGYEDDGHKIICKEAVEAAVAEHTASETVVRENWEKIITEYILLNGKFNLAPERERALELFKLLVTRAHRTDEINGKKVGFAAWRSYLHDLEHDDFSSIALLEADGPTVDGVANSVQHRFFIYCDGLCQIYARKDALPYYSSLAEKFPEWREELQTAVAALDTCADYGGFLWSQGFSFDENGFEKFRDPAARKNLADEGRRAMQMDMEAIKQFEKILIKEGK